MPINVGKTQSDEVNPWSEPINLSNSGGGGDPRAVMDGAQRIHVFWLDEFAGNSYSRYENRTWSDAVTIEVPFEEFVPVLIATPNFIHALWINASSDNAVQHSRAAADATTPLGAWSAPTTLVKQVADFDVVVDEDGGIHVAVIHNLPEPERNLPEGIIYRQTVDEGLSWSPEAVLYPSRYFRSLKPNQASIDLTVTGRGDSKSVYAVWDNPLLKRVFFARSGDSGITWREAIEIDGPTDESQTGAPFRIKVAAAGRDVLLIWQGNLQSGVYCSQYYQFSTNGGTTWDPRERMLQNVTGCADSNQLFLLPGESLLLETTIQDQVYLLAWDGEIWSEPQIQNSLFSFENPITRDSVTFRCRQSLLTARDRMMVVGCDDIPGGDVWVTERKIGEIESWFPAPSTWSLPVTIHSSPLEIFAADSLVDASGKMHFLWTQNEMPERIGDPPGARSILYSQWDGSEISSPVAVVKSPDKYVDEFAVAYDSVRGRIVVAFNSGVTGEIFYSWADIERATSALEWSRPFSVPILHPVGRFPDIVASDNGRLMIAYSIAINEDRGVYLVESQDGGESWSDPVLLYEADNSLWQAVAAPRLSVSTNGSVHVLWSQDTLFAEPSSFGLYYSQAQDANGEWADAINIYNEFVTDWWMVRSSAQGLHRFWVGAGTGSSNVFHDVSTDDGSNWSLPGNLTGLDEKPVSIQPYSRADGRASLMQILQDPTGKLFLKNQIWDGTSWQLADNLGLPEKDNDRVYSLGAVSPSTGQLSAFYVTQRLSSGLVDEPWEIMMLYRPDENSDTTVQPPTQPVQTTTGEAPLTPSADLTETPFDEPLSTLLPSQPVVVETPAVGITEALPSPTALRFTPDPSSTAPGADPTSLGMIMAGGIALVVVAVFFTAARMRRRH